WKLNLETVNKWIKETPDHPAPYLAKAEILISYAWDARGSGWAKDVTESQWSLFNSRIAEARQVLEDSAAVSGNHPYWFLTMEIVAKAQNWNIQEFEQLYNSAIYAYPTYYYIYFRAADYFQPRWHGSRKLLRQFVDNAVNKSRHKEGLTLYTRIYWSQLWALKDDTFAPGYAEWNLMKQGFEDIMKDYPNSAWNLNAYAYYSCMAKDWSTTKQLTSKIEDNPHLSIWGSRSRYFTCKSKSKLNN
ncbi:MAG: DUF4034 domain-containing protein, partial [Gammaproteobacteria bacterium]